MSVNVGQRKVKDNNSNRSLYACDKARELAEYTITICLNKKSFDPSLNQFLTKDLVETAKNIYVDAWESNNINVQTNQDKENRFHLQTLSISLCYRLLALIQLAKRVYHLRDKRVRYWSDQVIETKQLLKKWHKSDVTRYKKEET